MKKLYKISEISNKYKTTNRQLRFYEEKQILIPFLVDKNNGYRYYSEENCRELEKILCLKEIGLSLNDISSYVQGDESIKKSILLKYNNINQQENNIFRQIINNNDYNLSFTNSISYTGNKVKNKDISKLSGVWKLNGIYLSITEAKNKINQIHGDSPYKFLAFDKNGNSPWFYTANNKKIIFNTFNNPCSENYQILHNMLFVRISNFDQHIFGKIKTPIQTSHILVFEKISNNYLDYINLINEDPPLTEFVNDKKLIGVWKSPSNKILLVEKNGKATLCSEKGIEEFTWSKNQFYNNNLKVKLKYYISDNILNIERKTRVYTFSGILSGNDTFHKINL